ncbi:hypothetical protein FDUTEX481_03118 [Tolypothrix sp. PCC 7601]|nr:hypothetical protein FDUTEX481_03118 [Tolypothrix sp. PCC 7601]
MDSLLLRGKGENFWFLRTCYAKLLVKPQSLAEKYSLRTQTLAKCLKCY